MGDKIKEALGSLSFWLLVVAGIVAVLAQQDIISPELAKIVEGFCGVSIVVRRVDKFSK